MSIGKVPSFCIPHHSDLDLLLRHFHHDMFNCLASNQQVFELINDARESSSDANTGRWLRQVERQNELALTKLNALARYREILAFNGELTSMDLKSYLVSWGKSIASDVTINLNLPEGVQINSHHWLLDRLFGYLLDNSIAHSTLEIFQLQIDIVHADERGGIVVQFCDNGAGIDADLIAHIRQPFKGATDDTAHPGLGINCIDLIMQKHGGEVGIRNNPSWSVVESTTMVLQGFQVNLLFPTQ